MERTSAVPDLEITVIRTTNGKGQITNLPPAHCQRATRFASTATQGESVTQDDGEVYTGTYSGQFGPPGGAPASVPKIPISAERNDQRHRVRQYLEHTGCLFQIDGQHFVYILEKDIAGSSDFTNDFGMIGLNAAEEASENEVLSTMSEAYLTPMLRSG